MSEKRNCIFSDDRIYRYVLRILWDDSKPLAQFIGLNPSTADETNDDQTLRRVKDFARRLGFGGLAMTNLFAFRSTDPEVLKLQPNPVGELGQFISLRNVEFDNRNDFYLYTTKLECAVTIACWGTLGNLLYRDAQVKQRLTGMKCLKLTKQGHPGHPVRLNRSCQLLDFN